MSDNKASPEPLTRRVKKSREKSKEEGAKRLDVWLTPEAARALDAEASRSGESKTAVINRLLMKT
ncbi:hypothetical protein [Halomonas sp. Mc5H-6]|uniref:hypothetical protein n=1 Tax=Halomonas sp. Mc5H-6 TaxID=2954500 RepID=UPI002096FB99|nr:hypothetical protein [Halomonas sp. Mc5H-6]MCO7246378.1 hypothetical protein [Halomonas sp. Mc5H-6]